MIGAGILRGWSPALCLLLAVVVGCAPTTDEELPPFVGNMIATIKAEPVRNPPGSVWRYKYKGSVVFYVPPYCCDVPSELYASDGSFLCSPDGGFGGTGDGKCPDFFDLRTEGTEVWLDDR